MALVDIDVALLELQGELRCEQTEEPEGGDGVVEGMVPDVPGAFVGVDVQVCPAAPEPHRAGKLPVVQWAFAICWYSAPAPSTASEPTLPTQAAEAPPPPLPPVSVEPLVLNTRR